MSTCLTESEIRNLLDDTLSSADRTRAESHLATCERCRDQLTQIRPQFSARSGSDLVNTSQRTVLEAPYRDAAETIGPERAPSPDQRTLVDSAPPPPANDPTGRPAMATIDEFTQMVTQSGLMSAAELNEFQFGLNPAEMPRDAQQLSEALIRHHKLTQYQASALRRGQVRGLVLGNYVVLDKLGEGGMGMVYLALHRRMKRSVALKVLPPALTESSHAISRFHREVEAAAKLTHPNIAAAYDADEADGIHFLVMEYVDGSDLSAYVKRFGPVSAAAALQLILQAARGLAHAHSQGVVHRDIKPGNLLVNRQGVVKILDMGLAQLKSGADGSGEEQAELTQSGRVMGTVDYMAPEQALNAKHVDHRADIYSLGCTLFYLLAGRPMSPDGSLTQKLLWHQNEPVPSLIDLGIAVTPEVDQVFQKLVAKSPDERQQSMDEVVDDLERVLKGLSKDGLDELPRIGAALGEAAPINYALSYRPGSSIAERPTRTDVGQSAGSGSFGSSAALALGAAQPATAPAPQRSKVQRNVLIGGGLAAVALLAGGLALMFGGDNDPPPSPGDQPGGNPVVSPVVAGGGGGATNNSSGPTQIAAVPSTNGNPAGSTGQGTSALPPLPHERLLTMVFRHGGSASLGPVAGRAKVEVNRLEDVPRETITLYGIKLDKTSVQDDDLLALADAKGLQSLSLADTAISDEGLLFIRGLTSLWSLDLSQTRVTSKGLESVARLVQLRDLNLQKTDVTDQGMAYLANLKALEKLYLSDTRLGDAASAQLGRFTTLKHVALNGTYLSDEGYGALHAALPEADISWDGFDEQRRVANKLLDTDNRAMVSMVTRSGQVIENVRKKIDLPRERFSLTAIDLSKNPAVTNEDLKLLVGLTELQTLKLDGTDINEAGLPNLYGMQTLKLIDLGALQVGDAAVAELQKALTGCEIRRQPSSDLAAARWVLAQKGKVTVVDPDGRVLNDLDDAQKLPVGLFTLREVHLEGNRAIGDAELENLKDLSRLEGLYLSGTAVTDAGLVHLSGCTNLRDLNLDDTRIGPAGMAQIARFKSLRQLYLAGASLTGADLLELNLKALPALTHLSLARTALVDNDLLHLKAAPKLAWLNLSGTRITDAALANLARLTGLSELQLTGTELTDAAIEELMAQLPQCRLVHDPLDLQRQAARWVMGQRGAVTLVGQDQPLKIGQFPRDAVKVSRIDLAEVPNLRLDSLPQVLAACQDLRVLNLSSTPVADVDLAAIPPLKELAQLWLASTPVSDRGLASLAGWAKLEVLVLNGTRVTAAGLAPLAEVKTLKYIYLAQTRVSDTGLANLAAFPDLAGLDLGGNATVTDKGFAELGEMPNLISLSLRGTAITDAALKQVAVAKNLRYLDLSGTAVTDTGVAQLKGLAALETINLDKTQVGDGAASTLTGLKTLRSIALTRTRVTDATAKSLEQSIPGSHVTYSNAPPSDNEFGTGGGFPGQFGPGQPLGNERPPGRSPF